MEDAGRSRNVALYVSNLYRCVERNNATRGFVAMKVYKHDV